MHTVTAWFGLLSCTWHHPWQVNFAMARLAAVCLVVLLGNLTRGAFPLKTHIKVVVATGPVRDLLLR